MERQKKEPVVSWLPETIAEPKLKARPLDPLGRVPGSVISIAYFSHLTLIKDVALDYFPSGDRADAQSFPL